MEKNLAEEKARELVNMNYQYTKTQLESIEMCERAVLTKLCQLVDSLHIGLFEKKHYDMDMIEGKAKEMKWWQLVAWELQNLKTKLPG